MGKTLTWNNVGEKEFETGVSKGVLYPFDAMAVNKTKAYGPGVAWNGLTAFNESPSGAEATKLYADNQVYATMYSAEEYGATLEAYMSPDEFDECDGSVEIAEGVSIRQQTRKSFGFCYRTEIANDTQGDAYGYILHLVYGCKASPSDRSHATINDSPEAETLSWELSTTPVQVEGKKPTATLEINSTKISKKALAKIEEALYGTETQDAYLPLPAEIKAIVEANPDGAIAG